MHLSPALEKRVEDSPDEVGDLIVGCESYSEQIQEALQKLGFKVTDGSSVKEFLTLTGRMRLGDVRKLAGVKGVALVEEDREAHALD